MFHIGLWVTSDTDVGTTLICLHGTEVNSHFMCIIEILETVVELLETLQTSGKKYLPEVLRIIILFSHSFVSPFDSLTGIFSCPNHSESKKSVLK